MGAFRLEEQVPDRIGGSLMHEFCLKALPHGGQPSESGLLTPESAAQR
jgi:hypothetical protein